MGAKGDKSVSLRAGKCVIHSMFGILTLFGANDFDESRADLSSPRHLNVYQMSSQPISSAGRGGGG